MSTCQTKFLNIFFFSFVSNSVGTLPVWVRAHCFATENWFSLSTPSCRRGQVWRVHTARAHALWPQDSECSHFRLRGNRMVFARLSFCRRSGWPTSRPARLSSVSVMQMRICWGRWRRIIRGGSFEISLVLHWSEMEFSIRSIRLFLSLFLVLSVRVTRTPMNSIIHHYKYAFVVIHAGLCGPLHNISQFKLSTVHRSLRLPIPIHKPTESIKPKFPFIVTVEAIETENFK